MIGIVAPFILGPVLGALIIFSPAAEELPTDVNLATALDVSDSIMRHEAWIEFEGIARAVTAPAFLEAIARGRHRRIGFAVFTWSSGRPFRVIVPWTIIDSGAAAKRVALALRRIPRPSPVGGGDHEDASGAEDLLPSSAGRTDISDAIAFGAGLMRFAPHGASRRVLNIVGNGIDNVGAPPVHARQQALRAEITINAVVLRRDPDLLGYFRERVIGGFGSFVLEAGDPTEFTETMITKFLRDLISGRPPETRVAG